MYQNPKRSSSEKSEGEFPSMDISDDRTDDSVIEVNSSSDDSFEPPKVQATMSHTLQTKRRPPPRYQDIILTSDEDEETPNVKIPEGDLKNEAHCQETSSFRTKSEKEKSLNNWNILEQINKIAGNPSAFTWGSRNLDGSSTSTLTKRTNQSSKGNEMKRRNTSSEDFTEAQEKGMIDDIEMTAKVEVSRPLPIVNRSIMIAGTNVSFPLKPYPSQIAVMNALIRACSKEENALLESPTGSGKTLALLCGALAWQRNYTVNYQLQMDDYRRHMQMQNMGDFEDFAEDTDPKLAEKVKNGAMSTDPTITIPKPPPTIYYGSRTHRQISQVVKELKRTAYRNARMTILSSRSFTCIQTSNRDKTELCNDLLDPSTKSGCPYYNDSNKRLLSTYQQMEQQLENLGLESPFDIEDLVKVGEENGCCPYFAARNLMQEADIIFCPYNYLIDPSIRKSMNICLKNEIVILDEAHNIEDICRDSGSSTFKSNEIDDVITDCDTFAKNFVKNPADCPYFSSAIASFLELFRKFLKLVALTKKPGGNNMVSKYWTGPELEQVMHVNRMSGEMIARFVKACRDAIEHHNKVKEEARDPTKKKSFQPSISAGIVRILERFVFAFEIITSKEYALDYIVYVKESVEWSSNKKHTGDEFVSTSNQKQILRVIDFLCLNPGVVFKPLSNSARSVILASGTLSPISSFSSELETVFGHSLQTNHVTPKANVHVRAVPRGPSDVPLRATYANTQTWTFQEEVGKTILDVCETVPYGVLCFFSSYSVLNKVVERMRLTGIIDKIEDLKAVYEEPKTNNELAEVMRNYRENCQKKGALMFAVFRGKVAEGIDFSDNEARAVITVGIPFPVRNDPAIECKLAYNDKNSAKRLLKGNEWYAVNAYRALNQALGRCIRHREDWGAIIMIDDRFQSSSNHGYLPKWVLGMWSNRELQYRLPEELKEFVEGRIDYYERKLAEEV